MLFIVNDLDKFFCGFGAMLHIYSSKVVEPWRVTFTFLLAWEWSFKKFNLKVSSLQAASAINNKANNQAKRVGLIL